jgi:Fur family peroxide stress response transcriptional regulator
MSLPIRNNYYIVYYTEDGFMNDSAVAVFWQKSKESGLKRTPQRTAIFQELLKAKGHPTADAIYQRIVKKIPNISFDTVNRTLSTFSKIGVIKVVEGYGEPKRYDPDMGPHHHFRCLRCGRIIDFHNKDYDNIAVPREIAAMFMVTGKKVVLEGLCGQCGKA